MGLTGACTYAYQSDDPWNDFNNNQLRPHTMAYPTLSEPIPTLQWEGWREGVHDLRYLTTLIKRSTIDDIWLKEKCSSSAGACRGNIVKTLLSQQINVSGVSFPVKER